MHVSMRVLEVLFYLGGLWIIISWLGRVSARMRVDKELRDLE